MSDLTDTLSRLTAAGVKLPEMQEWLHPAKRQSAMWSGDFGGWKQSADAALLELAEALEQANAELQRVPSSCTAMSMTCRTGPCQLAKEGYGGITRS